MLTDNLTRNLFEPRKIGKQQENDFKENSDRQYQQTIHIRIFAAEQYDWIKLCCICHAKKYLMIP